MSTPADETVFAATITPHRSLGREAYRLVMTLCCISTVVASVPFMLLGAWPVAGFFGLDLLALAIAFHVNFRAARAQEHVVLSHVELMVRRVSHRGEARQWLFNPSWTRLERESDDEYGLQRIALVSGRQRVDFAAWLSPAERESLADALEAALARARRGPVISA
jgi:uncharacterized membrane protein